MRKQRNHSQLEDQEKSPERRNNKTDFFSLIHGKFKKEIMKTVKKLRTTDRNADYYEKELETKKGTKKNLVNSFLEIKVDLKVVNNRMKNAEQLSDLEDRIMEITQSEQQT